MLFLLIGAGIVLLAALTVLLEMRRERREGDPYRRILEQTPHYQEHRKRRR
jgi:hypothetical protein